MIRRVWREVVRSYRDMPLEMLPMTTIALLPLVLLILALWGSAH